MDVHIPSFRWLVLAGFVVTTLSSHAQTFPRKLTEEDRAIIEQSMEMTEAEVVEKLGSDWLKQAQNAGHSMQAEAQALVNEIRERNPYVQHAKQAQESSDSAYDTLIFVSYSLDRQTIDDILTVASGEERTVVVMRGIPEGTRIWEGLQQLQQMAATKNPMPNIILDPTLFEKYNVTVVPTIVALSEPDIQEVAPVKNPLEDFRWEPPAGASENNAKALASEQRTIEGRVEGLSNAIWLRREIKAGAGGDKGRRGPVEDIAERDLIEVMKERVMQIDWEQKKEQTIARYWHGQRFYNLPRAQKAEVRYIDASVIATADIRTSDGQFVARAGDRVNPLQTRAWTQAVVVFDPLDKRQMEHLANKLPEIASQPQVGNVVLIATQMDKDKGWDGYKAVTDAFQAPVYQLTPDVKTRFELRYTPSVITANETHFIVSELDVLEGDSESNQTGE